MLSENKEGGLLVTGILKMAKRIYDIPKLDYYALSDGIYAILQKTGAGIKSFIRQRFKNSQTQQVTMDGAFG